MSVDTWTQERVERLTKLWADGLSCAQIAADLGSGITRNAVIGRIHRAQLSDPLFKKQPKPEKKAKAPKRARNRNRQGDHHVVYKIVAGGGGSARVIESSESAETAKLRCVEIVPRRLSLMQIEDNECRYPYDGIDGEPTFVFCGHPKKDGSSFCAPHHFLCWTPAINPGRPARKYFGTDFARGAAA